jgi:hypothetical protein
MFWRCLSGLVRFLQGVTSGGRFFRHGEGQFRLPEVLAESDADFPKSSGFSLAG